MEEDTAQEEGVGYWIPQGDWCHEWAADWSSIIVDRSKEFALTFGVQVPKLIFQIQVPIRVHRERRPSSCSRVSTPDTSVEEAWQACHPSES